MGSDIDLNTIKGILTLRHKTGATISEICADYEEFDGTDALADFKTDFKLAKEFLHSIPGVYYKKNGHCFLWYIQSDNSQHIAELIEGQKSPRYNYYNQQNNNYHQQQEYNKRSRGLPYNRTNNLKKKQFYSSESSCFFQDNRNFRLNQYLSQPSLETRSERSITNNNNNNSSTSSSKFSGSGIGGPSMPKQQCLNNNYWPLDNNNYSSFSNKQFIQHQNQMPYYLNHQQPGVLQHQFSQQKQPQQHHQQHQKQHQLPTHQKQNEQLLGNPIVNNMDAYFYDYQLLGDDFFMEFATVDLGCKSVEAKNGINRCGFCISGQTIKDAACRMEKLTNCFSENLIINIGSVDLLHGYEFIDMKHDFLRLYKACLDRNIHPIITTIPPLANLNHIADVQLKRRMFNKFLLSTFDDILDIESCFVSNVGHILFDCYQPMARYVSGSNQPHTLWNRVGRQRVLKYMKKKITDFH